jgi:hypothetical protein
MERRSISVVVTNLSDRRRGRRRLRSRVMVCRVTGSSTSDRGQSIAGSARSWRVDLGSVQGWSGGCDSQPNAAARESGGVCINDS